MDDDAIIIPINDNTDSGHLWQREPSSKHYYVLHCNERKRMLFMIVHLGIGIRALKLY